MKGSHHPKNDVTINPSGNESIRDVIDRSGMNRRRFLYTAAGTAALTALGEFSVQGLLNNSAEATSIPRGPGFAGIGFDSIPPNLNNPATGLLEKDLVSVPKGYKAQVLIAWGDPIMPGAPRWKPDASQDAAAQEKQFGTHVDGMHYFPKRYDDDTSEYGFLCVNHEYTHEEILHSDGLVFAPATATTPQLGLPGSVVTIQKVRKSQAAHGVSVVEVWQDDGRWNYSSRSRFGRRITGNTEMRVSGPAAGNDLLKSKKFDITPTGSIDTGMLNDGFTAYGTLNNCANGYTPWGTYLTCEENWNGYFANPTGDVVAVPGLDQKPEILSGQSRYGISRTGFGYRWHEVDPRFRADTNPLEPNLFGWVVEIDPYAPQSTPVKRTAMGRFKHESAQVVVDDNNRVAFYQGDDERNEYIYKFVCTRPLSRRRSENRDMLDNGILYVAKFNADGTGVWLPLIFGQNGLTPENGFRSQGEVLIKTREAADRLGATMMDRPEWTAVRPRIRGFKEIEVYCTLTNNSRRGNTPASSNRVNGTTSAGSANPPVDAANPRPDNDYGHIIRWRENGRSVTATTFTWDIFIYGGDKLTTKTLGSTYTRTDLSPGAVGYKGDVIGDDFGAPDGLWFDDFGRLWIQTDQAGDGLGDWKNIGGNMMLCADPNTKQVRRFLTAPTNCEVTGITATPDSKTFFINIQHPGEDSVASNPTQFSNWPNSQGYGPAGRPRSATVVITRNNGGVIGG